MTNPRATVCLTFDFDAISIWIGPYGATSPSMISRGEFGVVGVERILRLLDRTGLPATFFVPGHTAETYPDAVRAIAAAGHEIGHHGYLHENPAALESKERERAILERGLEALERVARVRPVGDNRLGEHLSRGGAQPTRAPAGRAPGPGRGWP